MVNWEQRGCGRTYFRNHGFPGELSSDLLLSDLDELVDYLRRRFETEKVFLVGQSWGTVLGTLYAGRHPEKLAAYAGIGQVTDFNAGKILAAETALSDPRFLSNGSDREKMRGAIDAFASAERVEEIDISRLGYMIGTSIQTLKSPGEIGGLKQMLLGVFSSRFSLTDLRWFLRVSDTRRIFELEKPLIQYMYFDYATEDLSPKFDIPFFILQGTTDWITPTSMAWDFYQSLEAPAKEFVYLENAGHTPFLDHPEEFGRQLIRLLSDINH